MSEKKQESFTVTDRRLFTFDGEPRQEAEEKETSKPSSEPVPAPPQPVAADSETPPPLPTAAEQHQQAEAYKKSAGEMDRQVELGGQSAKELEVTFARFLASLYMTAMVQLGLMHQQGAEPRVDLIGARQTIDTIGLLAEKTKGNLDNTEEGFLQNALYELRMAYVEITNELARGPQTSPTGTDPRRK